MKPRSRHLATALALGAAVAALAAGCGSDNKSSDTKTKEKTTAQAPATSGGAKGATLAVAADPGGKLAFDKKTLNAKAGTATIAFTNSSQVPHALVVEGKGSEKKTQTIQGSKADLTVKLTPGKYEFYCPVDGHKAQGMKGELVVK